MLCGACSMCIWVLGTVSLRVIGVYAPAEQVSQNGIPDAPLFNHPLIFYRIKHLATPLLFYCLSSPPLHLWCQRKEKDSSICFAKIALGWGYLFDPVLQVKSFLDIETSYLNHLFWTYLQQSDQICLIRLFCVLLVWGYTCFRRVTEESCLMLHFLSARKILKTKNRTATFPGRNAIALFFSVPKPILQILGYSMRCGLINRRGEKESRS